MFVDFVGHPYSQIDIHMNLLQRYRLCLICDKPKFMSPQTSRIVCLQFKMIPQYI